MTASSAADQKMDDAIAALEAFGSKPKDAQDTIRASTTTLGLNKPGDELIRLSLQDGK